ncbi:hypothetical protein DSO57_1015845 [Entomophthora muscae]|uniref:Uncharacterized protein n=1 Tax=Entomophthora muscae TaxID=34485 RepID=A0ACC2UED7_9FUNG|nr:hypothetical protein DSO57_1015845 [Entomophthora muscae]
MHQKLKAIEDGKVPSRFCPLLLFASDPLKKYRAVQQLFETPQNNLRCFLDGIETDPGTASQEVSKEFDSQDEFLLQKMLASVLAQDGVLNRIKALQQDFDLYDVEGIYKMLETMDKSAISEANEQQWKELIQSYLKEQASAKDISLLSPSEKVALVHSFLISATFKDCSVIISFTSNQSRGESRQFTLEPELAPSDSKLVWAYQLGVVDLDPKPFKKLEEYIELDQKITRAFLENTGDGSERTISPYRS